MRFLGLVLIVGAACTGGGGSVGEQTQAVTSSGSLGPGHGPLNFRAGSLSPVHSQLNSSTVDANGRPTNNNLRIAISLALEAHPDVRAMVAGSAISPAPGSSNLLLLHEGVDDLGITLNGDALGPRGGNTGAFQFDSSPLGGHTFAELDNVCPQTSFADYALPNGSKVDLYLPKMTVLRSDTLVDLTPNGVLTPDGNRVGIDTNNDGYYETDWHVYLASLLWCGDLTTNVILLGKPFTGAWHGQTETHKVRPYETDLSYMCVQTSDVVSAGNVDTGPKWFCFHGVAGEGVFGFAYRTIGDHQVPGPRTTYVSELNWHGAHWDTSFLYDGGLAPVVTRSPNPEFTAAYSFYWNVNPNDNDGTPAGRVEQHRKYLAAVAVKTSSNRNDLTISPYTTITPGGLLPQRGELASCEDVTTSQTVPAGFPATPCDKFAPCERGELGAARECGWASDQLYACQPGTEVSIGMGTNAVRCEHPLGAAGDGNVLRVCAGVGGCSHFDALGEGDNTCGRTAPSVAFVCPPDGRFSVMKGTDDSDRMRDLPFDAPGGGVPGVVGVSVTATEEIGDGWAVTGACPGNVYGEARDCGWTVGSSYLCTPGTAISFGVIDPATCAPLARAGIGDAILRVCDGRSACTWNSTRRLAHGDDACGTSAPGVTFTCGPSGEFTAMLAPYASGAEQLYDYELGASGARVRRPEDLDIADHVDVASTGDLQNGLILQVALPESTSDRACDWGANWGAATVATIRPDIGSAPRCRAHDLAGYGFRVAANYDASSTWNRCPAYDPPPDSGSPIGTHDVIVTVRAGTEGALLVPVDGVREQRAGMTDTPMPPFTSAGTRACGDVACCVAEPFATTSCRFQLSADAGLTFQAYTGFDFATATPAIPGAVGWSSASASATRVSVVTNHDSVLVADFRTGTSGNFKCEPGEADSSDCPVAPSCNHDNNCGIGETGDNCPSDCANPLYPDLTAPFATGADLQPSPLAIPPSQDVVRPFIQVGSSEIFARATSSHGAAVTFAPTAIDDVDGPVPVECTQQSGSNFIVGSTAVQCFAVDAAGNVASASMTITVIDATITAPSDIVVDQTNPSGTVVTFNAEARSTFVEPASVNACTAELPPRTPDQVAVECSPSSGSMFGVGATTVTCHAGDPSSVVSTSFRVTVRAVTPPSITIDGAPIDSVHLVADATGPSGASVQYNAAATDGSGQPVEVSCSPSSGSLFGVGTTTVMCHATGVLDSSGSFDVTVRAMTPPSITINGAPIAGVHLVAAATSAAGASVQYNAAATDGNGQPVAVSCAPASGSLFSIGATTVTCTAGSTTGSFVVTVGYALFSGILQPINADGSSIFKLGSTVPVKFRLGAITNAVAHLYVAKVSNAIVGTEVEANTNGAGDTGNLFRWNGSEYIFNWSTKGLSTGSWQLRIDLGDGSTYTVLVSLR